VLIVLIQFIRPTRNDGDAASPNDITHAVPVPDSVMMVLKKSCYDCHSNHTDYPWYNQVAPISWWLRNHVSNGKRALNFSEFASYTYKKKAHRMDDVAETIEKHEMPLNSYLWIHKDAKLTDAQARLLTDWSKASAQKIMQDSLISIKGK
jgi:hypothetical protein